MRFCISLIFILFSVFSIKSQEIITYHFGGLNQTLDSTLLKFLKIDLSTCEFEEFMTISTSIYSQPLGFADIGYAPDGYLYGVGGLDVYRIDVDAGEVLASWSLPTGILPLGVRFSGMYINNEGLMYLSGEDGWMVSFDINTEEFNVLGMLNDDFPYRLTLFAIAEYRGRTFGSLVNGHLVEIFLDEMRAEYIMRSRSTEQSLFIYEVECGTPIFITGTNSGVLRKLDPELDTFYNLCQIPMMSNIFLGITSFTEYQEFPDCRDTIDLNSTLPGFDHFSIDECGDGKSYIADDSVQVYGDFPMDSIRIRIVDDPAGADGSLVAPAPSNGITVGSGTAELLTTGIMDFVDWESWLRQVEYVDSSDPPASGLRRIAVIGYFNEGERTDTAWSEIEVLVPEFSAGLGGEFEECPNGESVNLFTYLTGADEGGHWEPNFPDGEIELLPQYSGTYYYIVEDAECGSDTAQIELFVWPGPDVEITGGGIYCEGSTINLELQGDVGGTTSLLWSTGSTADRIEITEPGTYWLRMVYEEDCIWTDTVLVAFEDRTVVQEEIGLCPDEVLDWQGQQIIEEGQYETILSGSGGDCDTLLQLTVVASEYANANLSREICPGESFEINGTIFSEPGEFELVLPASDGCDTLLSILLMESDYTNANLSREICPGESFEINGTVFSEPGEFELVLPATDGCDTLLSIVVDWSEDIERRETLRICPGESIEVEGEMLSEAGEYEFTISSALGCDTILLVRLEHEFVPEAAIIGPDRVCEGEEILLRASPQEQLQQIFWSIGDISSEIRISEGGLYSFEAITYDDCGVYAEKWIEDCPSRQVYIPNAFSPNNDGVNDEWTIYTAAEAVEFEVQIYNRWGAKVFEQKGQSISWDGSYRNEILPGGVYVFQLRLIFSDSEIVDRIGEVMLVR